MFFTPSQPQYVACQECGACVPRWEADEHVCDPSKWVDFQMVKLGPALFQLERTFGEWLATPAGRFEQMYAERDRRVAPLHAERERVAA